MSDGTIVVETPEVETLPETDFAALVSESDGDETPVQVVQGAVEPVASEPEFSPPSGSPAETQPEVQPVVKEEVTPPAEAASAPLAAPVSKPAVELPAPVAAPLTEAELKAKRSELVEMFASNYSLSEDDAARFAVEPEKVLPKLAGNLAVDVFEATVRTVMAQIPQIVQQMTQSQSAAQAARDVFFREFPELNRPEYLPTIRQVAEMYRQMNPKAPYDEAQRAIGKHVSIMLGVAPSQGTSPAAAAPPPPPKPATPLQPGAAITRPPVAANNIFSELANFELLDA